MKLVKKHLNILVILLLVSHIYAQDTTYFKVNLKEETSAYYQIHVHEERYFVSLPRICNLTSECSSIVEIDLDGNVIWEKKLDWLDVALSSMVINNGIITISGNVSGNVGFYLHQMSVENGDSITTYRIEDPDDTYDQMFQLVNIKHNDQYLIAGGGKKNGEAYALIYVINLNGSLDTLINPIHTDREAVIWDMYIDTEGLLTVFLKLDTGDGDNYRMIIKYDDNFNIVWSYTTEELLTDGFSIPRACELQDGRTIFVYDIDHINFLMNSVRAINQDSTISWWYQWPDFSGDNAATVLRLKTLSNGDIIGVGQYNNTSSFELWVTNAPFIFRMSPEGEMLWQRIFIEQDPHDPERTAYGLLYDVHEFENGALWAVGGWKGQIEDRREDPIIILMDAEGCIISGCGELIPTPTTEVFPTFDEAITIFPNPIHGSDLLNIDIDLPENNFASFVLKIYNFQEKLLQQSNIHTGHNQIDFSKKAKGIYLLIVEKNGVVIGSKKVIK